ncbi:ABC transporter permease subunit [Nocardioides salsibiostraticola]
MALALIAPLGLITAYAPTTSAASMSSEGDRPVVRVGTEGTYPPFSYRDPSTGDLTGYDIDVMRAVGEEAGFDVEFVTAPFDALFAALDSGRIDAIANQVTINPEREANYLFTEPYTYSRGVIVTAAGTDDITSLEDLAGVTTAQSATSNWSQVARDAGATVQAVEGLPQAAALVAQGRVDALVNDNIAVLDYLASTGTDEVKIAGNVGGEVGRQALVFPQDQAALRDRADEAFAVLRDDGTLANISEEYFGVDVSVDDVADRSDPEVAGTNGGRSTWDVLRDTAGPTTLALVKATIPLTIISFFAGLALALVAALARMSSLRVLRLPARFYISAIRGTPLLVQLFIVFYGLPQIGISLPGFVAACLALSLNVGGYAAEIIRGAILSVPRGQFEAATTIGMGYRKTMRRIVLPQATRIAVPPLSNTLLSLVKDTSLVSVVLVTDLFRVTQNVASVTGKPLPLYLMAAAYFWVVCVLLSYGQNKLEKRLERFAV